MELTAACARVLASIASDHRETVLLTRDAAIVPASGTQPTGPTVTSTTEFPVLRGPMLTGWTVFTVDTLK